MNKLSSFIDWIGKRPILGWPFAMIGYVLVGVSLFVFFLWIGVSWPFHKGDYGV